MICCFPGCIARKLDHKWHIQGSNRHSMLEYGHPKWLASLLCHNAVPHSNYFLKTIYLVERQNDRDREMDTIHLLVRFPVGCNSEIWATQSPEPRAPSGSPIGVTGPTPFGHSPAAFLGALAGSCIISIEPGTWPGTSLGCHCHRW